MSATASTADVVRIALPRTRVFVVAAVLAAIAIAAALYVWGPLNFNRVSPTQQAATLVNAGLTAQLAGQTAEAANDYHKALKLDGNNYWAYYNLGVIDHAAGRLATAEREYRSALAISPDFVPALYNLAIILSGSSPKEAEDLYRHALLLQPSNATVHLNLGFLLIQEGNKAEGQAELVKAVKLDPALASRVPAASPTPAPAPSHRP